MYLYNTRISQHLSGLIEEIQKVGDELADVPSQ